MIDDELTGIEEPVVDEPDDIEIVDDYLKYKLYEQERAGRFWYTILDAGGRKITEWSSQQDALGMSTSEYKNSNIYSIFKSTVDRQVTLSQPKRLSAAQQHFSGFEDDDDYYYNPSQIASRSPYSKYSGYGSSAGRSYDSGYSGYSGTYTYTYKPYTPPPKTTGYVDKLNKSNTLVIHCADSTTEMLKPIYEGKGWDVLNDGNIDKDELHTLLENHERIIMLGHGTPSGLINKQGGGMTIDAQDAKYLSGKKLFAIWCYAGDYFKRNLPDMHNFVCSNNAPSDAGEASWIGYHVSQTYMNDNITDWCQYCADVIEECLEGDPHKAVKYIRDRYWEKYGQGYDPEEVSGNSKIDKANKIPDEVGVTKFNYDSIHVQ